jgi:hypothetical protein
MSENKEESPRITETERGKRRARAIANQSPTDTEQDCSQD